MVDPSAGISGALGLVGVASNKIEYWRKYKGRRIQIRETQGEVHHEEIEGTGSEVPGSGGSWVTATHSVFAIEGTIEDVVSFPPGFRLVDVEEWASHDYLTSPEQMVTEDPLDRRVLRRVDEKFVALAAAEEIEFVDNGGTEDNGDKA